MRRRNSAVLVSLYIEGVPQFAERPVGPSAPVDIPSLAELRQRTQEAIKARREGDKLIAELHRRRGVVVGAGRSARDAGEFAHMQGQLANLQRELAEMKAQLLGGRHARILSRFALRIKGVRLREDVR